jgi:hypothetical protein
VLFCVGVLCTVSSFSMLQAHGHLKAHPEMYN